MQDDLIDFSVSDVWRDHYAAQHMTYPSGRYRRATSRSQQDQSKEVRELKSIIHILRDQLAERHLTRAHPHLAKTEDPAPPKPSTFDE